MSNRQILARRLISVPLNAIQFTRRNPRTAGVDAGADSGASAPASALNELGASLGEETDPLLAQPPILEEITPGLYRVTAGERRVRAALERGWQTLECLVYPTLDPFRAHQLRLLENLHRQAMNPVDEAAALRITWLFENAVALDLGEAARAILNESATLAEQATALQALLADAGWNKQRPAVTWDDCLDRYGLALGRASRNRLMKLLALDEGAQALARETQLTEAALRSIGTLAPTQQVQVLEQVKADPQLARRVRRIARVVKNGSYTLAEALAEAKGQVVTIETAPAVETSTDSEATSPVDTAQQDAVLAVLDVATALNTALSRLRSVCPTSVDDLPAPWDTYAREALDSMRAELREF